MTAASNATRSISRELCSRLIEGIQVRRTGAMTMAPLASPIHQVNQIAPTSSCETGEGKRDRPDRCTHDRAEYRGEERKLEHVLGTLEGARAVRERIHEVRADDRFERIAKGDAN